MRSDKLVFYGNILLPQMTDSTIFEPAHEIMALFVLRNLILQTRMRSHPAELDV